MRSGRAGAVPSLGGAGVVAGASVVAGTSVVVLVDVSACADASWAPPNARPAARPCRPRGGGG
ncbi:MAG: hypothetical protein R2746_17450 [Acidimicrobiales bacterium]